MDSMKKSGLQLRHNKKKSSFMDAFIRSWITSNSVFAKGNLDCSLEFTRLSSDQLYQTHYASLIAILHLSSLASRPSHSHRARPNLFC